MPEVGRFLFDTPEFLVDKTNYTYRAIRHESLSLTADPPGESPFDEHTPFNALARIGRRSEGMFGSQVVLSDISSFPIAGQPGQWMTLLDRSSQILYRLVSGIASQGLLVILTYANLRSSQHSQEVFEHCIASVRFDGVVQLPAHNYRRVYAAGLWLDVPKHLSSPFVMVFTSDDELVRVRISLGVNRHVRRGAPADDVARGSRVERLEVGPYQRGNLIGEQCSYYSYTDDRECPVRYAILAEGGSAVREFLSIECRGAHVNAQEYVERVFALILGSVSVFNPASISS